MQCCHHSPGANALNGGNCAGFLTSCIPMMLDIRAISALASNTAAAAHAACALLACAEMNGKADLEAAIATKPCDSCQYTDATGQSVRLLQRLAAVQPRVPLSMLGQCRSAASVAAELHAAPSSHAPEAELALLHGASGGPASSTVVGICARASAALKLRSDAAERVQRPYAVVQEISFAAAELQFVAENLASCADELCAVPRAEWAAKTAAAALSTLQQAFGLVQTGSLKAMRLIAIACSQRMAVVACSAAEASCQALELCMRTDDVGDGGALSFSSFGRWHLSLQLAQSALLAVRLSRELGLGATRISWAALAACGWVSGRIRRPALCIVMLLCSELALKPERLHVIDVSSLWMFRWQLCAMLRSPKADPCVQGSRPYTGRRTLTASSQCSGSMVQHNSSCPQLTGLSRGSSTLSF